MRHIVHELRFFFACAVLASISIGIPYAAAPMASGGHSHSLALHADGTVRSWGIDRKGELGIGSVLFRQTPQRVEGLPAIRPSAAAIAINEHVLAVAADGSVWAWGWNASGQLGDGTRTTRSSPVRVAGLSDVVAVAAGFVHSMAITADGNVWTWGHNGSRQLGDSSADASGRIRPQRIALNAAVAISVGRSHSLVLRSDGTVWAFGDNAVGQIGDGTSSTRVTPVRVSGLTDVVAISAGRFHNLALKSDGSVWAWGHNDMGQLGDGTTIDRRVPVQVPNIAAVKIAAGQTRSYVARADGIVLGWGERLGVVPTQVPGYEQIIDIKAGQNFSVGVRADGTVWTEGSNDRGRLGREQTGNVAGAVPGLTGISAVAAARATVLAVGNDGNLYAWGDNTSGTLATARALNKTTPSFVPSLQSVVQVSAGGSSLALRGDGTVATWGALGESTSSPRIVAGLSEVVQVAAGEAHSVALKSDGTVWTWGFNTHGQLGRGNHGPFIDAAPAIVPGLGNVTRIAAGPQHTAAVRDDGTVWVWGRNDAGALGVPAATTCVPIASESFPCNPAPVQVAGIGSVADLSTSFEHFLALRFDGSVWAWGNNLTGALGDDLAVRGRPPAPVANLGDVVQVAAGGDSCAGECRLFSIALKRDGTVWTWGDNSYGQLGDATPESRFAPRMIESLVGIGRIAAGRAHGLALRGDGALWAWGGNDQGQVGDGTVADRFRPVIVVREDGAGNLDGGDWFLDLHPDVAGSVALDKAFAMVVEGSIDEDEANVSAQIRPRTADAGSTGSVYVFALAPATVVKGLPSPQPLGEGRAGGHFFAKDSSGKDTPVQCVLAQLTSSGQLVAVSASSLQAYITGVLTSQIQAVTIINGVPTVNIGGATFYVGYGSSAAAMLGGGTNRSAATVPGQVSCQPQAPQTGWWWNPLEDGRGYSIEVRGNNLFFASFLYDVTGRSNWYVATGPTSLDGSLFNADLLSARGGQSLGGTYPGFPTLTNEGAITLAFNDAKSGTLVWPGGSVPIQRFNIVPNGLTLPPVANQPESGWWWNPNEAGRGFFLEWQGGILNIAGYMYDDAGNPVWYLTQNATPTTNAQSFSSNWWSFANGMTLMGPWRPHTRTNDNVAPVTIQFQGSENAIMTLPNGRTTALTRHRF